MKKIIPLVLIATLGISGAAMAKNHPQGGFNDGANNMSMHMGDPQGGFQGGLVSATTVEQAKNLPDDSWVMLKGNITKQVGKNEYTFKDSTGEIKIEIDHKRWRGQTVTPADVVEITGEVDKDWNDIEIDVKQIKVIQSAQTPAVTQ